MRLHDLGEQRIHIGLLVTSAAAASAAPPLPRISATMPSSTSLRRATSTVLAPSAAKFSAMALPMPELAPVTMATRSSSCFMGDSHGDGAHLDQVLWARPSWSTSTMVEGGRSQLSVTHRVLDVLVAEPRL